MKQIRKFMMVVAFTLGIGFAFSFTVLAPQDGFSKKIEVQQAGGIQLDDCQNRQVDCTTEEGIPCTWQGPGMSVPVDLYNTGCSQPLNFDQ